MTLEGFHGYVPRSAFDRSFYNEHGVVLLRRGDACSPEDFAAVSISLNRETFAFIEDAAAEITVLNVGLACAH